MLSAAGTGKWCCSKGRQYIAIEESSDLKKYTGFTSALLQIIGKSRSQEREVVRWQKSARWHRAHGLSWVSDKGATNNFFRAFSVPWSASTQGYGQKRSLKKLLVPCQGHGLRPSLVLQYHAFDEAKGKRSSVFTDPTVSSSRFMVAKRKFMSHEFCWLGHFVLQLHCHSTSLLL